MVEVKADVENPAFTSPFNLKKQKKAQLTWLLCCVLKNNCSLLQLCVIFIVLAVAPVAHNKILHLTV